MAAIEFSILASKVGESLVRQIVPTLDDLCLGIPLDDVLVDHLALTDAPRLAQTGGAVQAFVPLKVFLVGRAALDASVNGEPATTDRNITAIFDIALNGLFLDITFHDVQIQSLFPPLLPIAQAPIKSALRALLGPVGTRIDLGAVLNTEVFKPLAATITAGALATDGHLLAARFEIDHTEGGNPGAALAQPLPDHLDGRDAGLWIEAGVMERMIDAILQERVLSKLPAGIPQPATEVRWEPDGSTPRVHVHAEFKVPVPNPFSLAIIIDAFGTLSIANIQVMGAASVVQIGVNWDLDTAGDPLVGAVGQIALAVADALDLIPGPLPDGAVATGKRSFVVTSTVQPISFGPATLLLNHIAVVGEGAAFSGPVQVQPLPDVFPFEGPVLSKWFVGRTVRNCAAEKTRIEDTGIQARRSATFTNPGRLCRIDSLDSPDQYTIIAGLMSFPAAGPADRIDIGVLIPEEKLRFVLSRYKGNFGFRVTTSRGVRIIALGRPDVAFNADGTVAHAGFELIEECPFDIVDPWVLRFGVRNPRWLIDPSPEQWRVRKTLAPVMVAHTIRVRNLDAGQRMELTSDGLGQRAVSPAQPAGRFTAPLLMPVTAREVTARLTPLGGPGAQVAGAVPPEISVARVMLQRVSAFGQQAPITASALGSCFAETTLAVGLPDRVALFSLHDPENPLRFEFDGPGARGIILAPETAIAYGDFGVSAFDGNISQLWSQEPISGIVPLPGSTLLAVLSPRGVGIWEPGGKEITLIDAPEARGISIKKGHLIVALADRLWVFGADGPALPFMAETLLPPVARLVTVPDELGADLTAVVLEDGTARLLEIGGTGEAVTLAELDEAPWFTDTAWSGGLAVLPDTEGNSVVIYRAG
jgi:hypothetical protein